MSEPTEELTALQRLEKLAASVVAARRELEAGRRSLSAAQVAEKLDILQKARDTARHMRAEVGELEGPERSAADTHVSQIEEAWQTARQTWERKAAWEQNVEPHIQVIKEAGRVAVDLHRELRNKRRDLSAAAVGEMKSRLEGLHADAVGSCARLAEAGLPGPVKGLVDRSMESLERALKDVVESFATKSQWEVGLGANRAALEQIVTELEQAVAGGADPAIVQGMVRRVASEMERRRPLEAGLKQALEARVEAVAQGARAVIQTEREERNRRLAEAREAIPRLFDQLDRLLPPLPERLRERKPAAPSPAPGPAPAAPAPEQRPDAAGAGAEAAELPEAEELVAGAFDEIEAEVHAEPAAEDEHEGAPAEGDPPPPSAEDMEKIMILEAELKLHLNSPWLGAAERRRALGQLRQLGRRIGWARRLASRAQEDALAGRVDAVIDRVKGGAIRGILREIQAMQKEVNAAPVHRRRKEVLQQRLRAAWTDAVGVIEKKDHERHDRDQQRMRELGGHLTRWERRVEGLEHLVHRLEADLVESERRAKNSTSIGFRVVAEKFRVQTEERILDLKLTRDDLLRKIAEVKPRLVEAGWPWPEEAAPEGGASAEGAQGGGAHGQGEGAPRREGRQGGQDRRDDRPRRYDGPPRPPGEPRHSRDDRRARPPREDRPPRPPRDEQPARPPRDEKPPRGSGGGSQS